MAAIAEEKSGLSGHPAVFLSFHGCLPGMMIVCMES
jgi:hypothetical protein